MSRETSAGVATVTQLCEAFGISRAAYYAARKKPEPAWGVRKVWATLKRKGLKVSRKRVHALTTSRRT